MARSYGANATFAAKLEANYGTPPGGDFEVAALYAVFGYYLDAIGAI
jgi:hypothetical protein